MGARLLTSIDRLMEVKEQFDRYKATMDHNAADPNYDDVGLLFGVPIGDEQVVYNLVATTVSQLAHADIAALTSRVGRPLS
jgi:hypothetical protein